MLRTRAFSIALLLAALILGACQPIQAPATEAPAEVAAAPPVKTVLIIGNGLLDGTCCIDQYFAALTNSATPAKEVTAKQMVVYDATLQTHYRYMPTFAPLEVKRGGHDVVVLQDDLPSYSEKTVEIFKEIVPLFDADIRAAGGRTVLFMGPDYPGAAPWDWVTLEEIAAAHRAVSAELGIPVAPVGLAMQRATAERPDLPVMGGGGETMAMVGAGSLLPSPAGAYLSAAVLYATIYGEDPSGLPYRPEELSEADAAFLQRIAWETVQAWESEQ